jgi:hypothetical protein
MWVCLKMRYCIAPSKHCNRENQKQPLEFGVLDFQHFRQTHVLSDSSYRLYMIIQLFITIQADVFRRLPPGNPKCLIRKRGAHCRGIYILWWGIPIPFRTIQRWNQFANDFSFLVFHGATLEGPKPWKMQGCHSQEMGEEATTWSTHIPTPALSNKIKRVILLGNGKSPIYRIVSIKVIISITIENIHKWILYISDIWKSPIYSIIQSLQTSFFRMRSVEISLGFSSCTTCMDASSCNM